MTAVLVIAGVDSSGGAGLLRDTRTFAELGVEPLCAVTAVTAQTNCGVLAVHHVPAAVITEQIKCAFANPELAAVKIGMLGTAATTALVADSLEEGMARSRAGRGVPIILDPVLHATSGAALLDPEGRQAMLDRLFPIATLVTPNLPEAAALLDCAPARDDTDVMAQAARLLKFGPFAILLKGGHAAGTEAADYLAARSDAVGSKPAPVLLARSRASSGAQAWRSYTRAPSSCALRRFALPRVDVTSRGTGCTLASAIAAQIALGLSLEDACYEAKKFVHSTLVRQATNAR